jgi:hypothetical protein
MKVHKWNTARLALYGAAIGAVYEFVIEAHSYWSEGALAAAVSMVIGGAIGGAILFAIASGVGNLFAR